MAPTPCCPAPPLPPQPAPPLSSTGLKGPFVGLQCAPMQITGLVCTSVALWAPPQACTTVLELWKCARMRIKGLGCLFSLLMAVIWDRGSILDGVLAGLAPATLGELELAPGLFLSGFVNHGPATRLARIAKALPQQTTVGFSRWMPPLLPAFRVWRVGHGSCRAGPTTEIKEPRHVRGAHMPR